MTTAALRVAGRVKRALVLTALLGVALLVLFSDRQSSTAGAQVAPAHAVPAHAAPAETARAPIPPGPRRQEAAQQRQSSIPVEDISCGICHEQVTQGFGRTVHGKARRGWEIKTLGGDGYAMSCQTCHEGGAEHVAQGGDPTKIKNPAKLKAREASETCSSCHSQPSEHAQWRGSRHESAGLSCLSCHSAHNAPAPTADERRPFGVTKAETKLLKARSEADTCYQCHGDVRRAQYQRSTHLFRNEDREHQVGCSSCHEPHGSAGVKMMRRESLNETCYTCHTEMRGPFLWEHAPVREDCSTCHKAHGSNNTNLLRQRAPMLCQQCHIQGRHQTVAGRPNTTFNTYRSCATCHSAVHGSNHPSGINLMR
jgi:DmsE family decaheme c-type cytochrome